MRSPLRSTPAQTLECFRLCQQLIQMYLPIYVVRLDERTDHIVIIGGEEIVITIDRNGESAIL